MDEYNELSSNPTDETSSSLVSQDHDYYGGSEITNQLQCDSKENTSSISVETIDELQVELDATYKTLIDSIVTARQACNKLKERKVNCLKKIEEQKTIINNIREQSESLTLPNEINDSSDDDLDNEISSYKDQVKQKHCARIALYSEKIHHDIDEHHANIPHYINAIREELNIIDAKVQLIESLKKLDSFYREYKIFHYQSDAAEKRFQNALAIFETNKL